MINAQDDQLELLDIPMEDEAAIIDNLIEKGSMLTESDVLDQLECFQQTPLYVLELKKFMQPFIADVLMAGIKKDLLYTQVLTEKYQVTYFRKNQNIFVNVQKKFWIVKVYDINDPTFADDGKEDFYWEDVHKLWFANDQDSECLRILPENCVYEGETWDTYEQVCRGFVDRSNALK